jgi:uncharacterized tellurite resistance protein B-like protein
MRLDQRADDIAEAAAGALRQALTRLHSLEPPTAERLASLAFVLSRIANADEHISQAERSEMETIVAGGARVPTDVAMLAVEIAAQRADMADCACAYSVSRQLRETTSDEARARLLESLASVATADGRICVRERAEIEQIAAELGLCGRAPDRAPAP